MIDCIAAHFGGPPLPASANNWIRGSQLADIPPPQSATLGLHSVARSYYTQFPSRLGQWGWVDLAHNKLAMCSRLLANDPRLESNRNLKVTSRHQPPGYVHSNVLQVATWQHSLGVELATSRSRVEWPKHLATNSDCHEMGMKILYSYMHIVVG